MMADSRRDGRPEGDGVLVAPSVLSADALALGEELRSISTADLVHFDVMDGHFVPNLSFGPDLLRAVRRGSALPVDCHLMVSNPEEVAGDYLAAGATGLTFHVEAATHAHRLCQAIHQAGARACVALNPATPVVAVQELLGVVDMVLVMTVNPGFGGQSLIEGSFAKLRRLRALMDEVGAHPLVEVDGGVTAENARALAQAGADVLVAGSAVFKAPDRAAAVAAIRDEACLGIAGRCADGS